MVYKIYTDEIQRIHCEYLVTADSKKEALKRFDNGMYDDTPAGDIYDNEIVNIEIEEYD